MRNKLYYFYADIYVNKEEDQGIIRAPSAGSKLKVIVQIQSICQGMQHKHYILNPLVCAIIYFNDLFLAGNHQHM